MTILAMTEKELGEMIITIPPQLEFRYLPQSSSQLSEVLQNIQSILTQPPSSAMEGKSKTFESPMMDPGNE